MNALDNANIADDSCGGLASFAFPKVRSSRTGVSVEYAPDDAKRWYVLRILYGHSRQAADAIIEGGNYAWLAMIWKMERRDGKKRRRLVPFLNLVFAHLTAEQSARHVADSPESRFVTYYYDHFSIGSDGKNPPLTVSDRDMREIVLATALQDVHVMEVRLSQCNFVSNDLVRVTRGPFQGITGRVARIARQNRVVIAIKGLNSGLTTAYIPPHCLEKVE